MREKDIFNIETNRKCQLIKSRCHLNLPPIRHVLGITGKTAESCEINGFLVNKKVSPPINRGVII